MKNKKIYTEYNNKFQAYISFLHNTKKEKNEI